LSGGIGACRGLEESDPLLDETAVHTVPEVDFFTDREHDLGVTGKLVEQPGRTPLLHADTEKIDHRLGSSGRTGKGWKNRTERGRYPIMEW
jgi:hypothetical protein